MKTNSLKWWQEHFDSIYRKHNDRLFDRQDFATFLLSYVTRILKGVRKKDSQKIEKNIVSALGWTIVLGNRLHIDMTKEINKRFPGVCPYCKSNPCDCGNVRPAHRQTVSEVEHLPREMIPEIQKMFAEIYPANTLDSSAIHLAEEVGEVSVALARFRAQSTCDVFRDQVKLEFVDVVANLCAVANCASLDLEQLLAAKFSGGCPACSRTPCNCDYDYVANSVS